jgi:hypothetical protein
MKFAALLLLLALAGCHESKPVDPFSPEFKKSARFAHALLQQADQGQTVLKSDLSRALADVQAQMRNSDEQMAFYMLSAYRADLEYQAMTRMTAQQEESMKQAKCELDKMLNNGMHGIDAMKACGEKVPQ